MRHGQHCLRGGSAVPADREAWLEIIEAVRGGPHESLDYAGIISAYRPGGEWWVSLIRWPRWG